MKTVVLSSNTSWYLYNFRSSTIRAFLDKGYNVVCVSPKDEYSEKLVGEVGCKWINLIMDNQSVNPIKDSMLFFRLLLIYFRLKPVAIFNFTIKNNIYGTWAAKCLGISVFNNISGLGTAFIKDNLISKFVRVLYKFSQPFANEVFCQNSDDMQLLIKNGLVDSSKLSLLPGSGINTEYFSPKYCKNKENKSLFKFVFIGRMIGDKGIYELLDAAQCLFEAGCHFKLTLCGPVGVKNKTAISEDELRRLTNKPYLDWIGESKDVRSVLSSSHCIILPSYREGLPRTLLEAGSMGLPSITTNVPGCKHVITHQYNGLLCDVKCSESLFLQMKNMLQLTESKYLAMCKNSRVNVLKCFDEKIVIQFALDALDSTCNRT